MDRGRRIGIALSLLMYRQTVAGMNRVPATGPLVVVANHSNFWDGPVLFGALPRRVSFLIKAEAVTGPMGWLLRNVGQYAINRDVPDRKPLLEALSQLKAGGAIGVFPEGTRGDGNVQNISSGAGWLAARPGPRCCRSRCAARPVPKVRAGGSGPKCGCWSANRSSFPLGAGRTAVDAATDLIRDRLSSLVIQLDEAISSIHGKREMQ